MNTGGILFLDVDGVLAHHRIHRVRPRRGMRSLDPIAVEWINQVCKKYRLSIVLVSVWRNDSPETFPFTPKRGKERNAMNYLIDQGITAPFHSDWKTPRGSTIRGDDMDAWIGINGMPKRMLIVDDSSDYHDWQLKYLARAHAYDGILFDTMQQAEAIMARQMPAARPKLTP